MAESDKATSENRGLHGTGEGLNRKRGKGKKKQKAKQQNQVSNDRQSAQLKKKQKSKTGSQISINKEFAERYEQSKRRQLLANTPANLLESDSESSSSSEEEDEFAEQWTKKVDQRFRETFDAITKKDPKIYDPSAKFFSVPEGNASDPSDGENVDKDDEPVAGWDTIAKAAQEQRPKMTLKDYVREQLVTHGGLGESDSDEGAGEVDDDEEGEQNSSTAFEQNDKRKSRKSKANIDVDRASNGVHPEESRNVTGASSDSGENDSDNDFFTKKEKTDAEMEEEDKEFEKFLAKKALKESRQKGEDLLLHSYLENENPDEKERFLRDFVMNNGWLDKNAAEAPLLSEYAIEVDKTKVNLSEEEDEDDFDDRNDMFEAQHNFRFEDPDGAQITGHARNIPDTMRRPDDRRKKAREARKERKRREKEEKTEEIKRLKNLKKREIQARLLAIQEAAGGGIDVSGVDLDADYDPDAFDKQMSAKFGDEYYAQEDEGIKKVVTEDMAHASEGVVPSEKSEVVPEDIQADVDKLMDEYYNLDYEDIVGGKPTRFSYKKVEEESFGLTAQDILEMDDKELNRIVSLKYVAPYHPRNIVKRQAWKARAALQKHKKAKQQAFDVGEDHDFDQSGWYENGSGHYSSGKGKKELQQHDEVNGDDSAVGEASGERSTRTPSKSEPSEAQPSAANGQKSNELSKRKRKKRKRSAEPEVSAAVLDITAGAEALNNNAIDEAGASDPVKKRRKRRKKPRTQPDEASTQNGNSSTAAETPSTEIVNPEEESSRKKKKNKKKRKNKSSTMAEFSENRLKAYGLKVDR